jgi:hypothetical protein
MMHTTRTSSLQERPADAAIAAASVSENSEPFGGAAWPKKHRWLIYYERKMLFRLKK